MTDTRADIVERIRSLRYVHVPQASQLFEEACREIERLRQVALQKNLTDAERCAIKEASEFYVGTRVGVALSGLLTRLCSDAAAYTNGVSTVTETK